MAFELIKNDMVTNTIERRATQQIKRSFHAIDYVLSIVDSIHTMDAIERADEK